MKTREIENKIETLRQRIETLENRLQNVHNDPQGTLRLPHCPLCLGRVAKSTLYDWWFCQQEYGHCGFLVLHPVDHRRGGDWPKAHFTRTQYNDVTGELHGLKDYAYNPKRVWFFIAGKEVTQEEYFSMIA